MPEPVRYAEPGSSYWPVLWGPVFALVGAGLEAITGPVHLLAWPVLAGLLAGFTVLWVRARRRSCAVLLTDDTLTLGTDRVPTGTIDALADPDTETTQVLGQRFTVPRTFDQVPVRLTDGRTALAWARDGAGLRAALTDLLAERTG